MAPVVEFLGAASPWIAMGLLRAVFFARRAGRKGDEGKRGDYGSEGMALGMCFGVAMATSLQFNVGLGMMAGMAIGLVAGSAKER